MTTKDDLARMDTTGNATDVATASANETASATSGQWYADPYDELAVIDADREQKFRDGGLPRLVARVHADFKHRRPLVAAAPDLLAALRDQLDRYVSLVNSGDAGNWDPETEDTVIAARAAIAKAEGRA